MTTTTPPPPIVQPPLPQGTSVYTVWIWLLSFVPLVSLALSVPAMLAMIPVFQAQIDYEQQALNSPETVPTFPMAGFLPAFGTFAVLSMLSFVLTGVVVLCGVLDWRALRRRGIVRPFFWAWIFLGLVYVIGRAVVVHRRTGRGYPPMWTAIGVEVAVFVVQIVVIVSIFTSFLTSTLETIPRG